jgi:hypothetical protein
LLIKEEHKRKYMKIRSMRSVLILLFICLIIAGPVTGATSIEALSIGCTDDTYPGLPNETGIAVVEVSGHGDTSIDGKSVEPVGVGTYKGYDTRWYGAGEGSHKIFITREGYLSYTSYMVVCDHKVSYVYYDQASHPYPGMTGTATATTVEPATTMFAGQSSDYGALKAALGTTAPPDSPGSLSVTTDPGGATIFIDGVQQGISPATIPGLAPGTHTLLLKRDGYQDLSTPVVISAGKTHSYSSALLKSGAAPAGTAGTATTKKSSAPGPGTAVAACVAGILLLFRKTHP